jgi:hypothetical protein
MIKSGYKPLRPYRLKIRKSKLYEIVMKFLTSFHIYLLDSILSLK